MTDNLIKISAVIIAKNEEANIAQAIDSLKEFSEIIVLDSGSTDKTVEIAKYLGAKVYQTDWPGFSTQRKRGLDYTTQSWVLFLDADESLDKKLQHEILKLENNVDIDGYSFKWENYLIGKPIVHSRWGNDWHLRLVKKEKAYLPNVEIHEGICVKGKTKRINNGVVIHNTMPTITTYLNKILQYSSLEAKQKKGKRRRYSTIKLLYDPISEFYKIYIVHMGWRDGVRGFMIASFSALYKILVMVKLREIENG